MTESSGRPDPRSIDPGSIDPVPIDPVPIDPVPIDPGPQATGSEDPGRTLGGEPTIVIPPVTGTQRQAGDEAGVPRSGAAAPEPAGRSRRGIRVRTVVFGLILLAISASVLVTLLTTAQIDATAVTFVVLIGAGAALLAGGLAAAVREARGGPGA